MVKKKVQSKKGEETLVTTVFSNPRSLITFLIAVALLLGLLVLLRTYSSIVGSEKTIEVKSDDDLTMAKQRLQDQVQQLQQDVGDLRALVT